MPLKRLLEKAATLTITEAEISTLASRLARLERELTPPESAELDEVAGRPLGDITRGLVAAVDPDRQAQAVAEAPLVEGVIDAAAAVKQLLEQAVEPLAANPELRNRLLEIRRAHDLVIDETSQDVLLDAHGVVDTERARGVVTSWKAYLEENKDEITTLQLLYSLNGKVTFAELRELAERIKRPPRNWTPDLLWTVYVALEADADHAHVRRSDRHTVTDLISRPGFLADEGVDLSSMSERIAPLEGTGRTVVAVAVDGRPLGLISLGDEIGADSAEAVTQLRQAGITPVLVTGDNARAAQRVAAQLGIDDVRAWRHHRRRSARPPPTCRASCYQGWLRTSHSVHAALAVSVNVGGPRFEAGMTRWAAETLASRQSRAPAGRCSPSAHGPEAGQGGPVRQRVQVSLADLSDSAV